MTHVSAAQFADAFCDIDAELTGGQREMLTAHAISPGRTFSMQRIAGGGGYDSHVSAQLDYRALGEQIAGALQIEGRADPLQVFCENAGTADDAGHARWTLREPAFEALVELGIVCLDEAEHPLPAAASMDAGELAGQPPTTRKALVEARLGQGAYRKKMLRSWGGACALTGCSVEAVLVASHAVPWRLSSSQERLDHHNGLLLTATLDRLFDSGLIGFSSEGVLVISPRLTLPERALLGLTDGMKLRQTCERLIRYLDRDRALHAL